MFVCYFKQMNIKHFFTILSISLITFSCQPTKVYLVRHAEKAAEPVKDPGLTDIGKERALDLAAYFSKIKLDAVFSTPFKRTQETASPLLNQKKINLKDYQPNQAGDVAAKALANKQHTLLIGHSNTLLPAIQSLGLQPNMEQIADDDYDNLFIISKKRGKLELKHVTYGVDSPNAKDQAASYQMKIN